MLGININYLYNISLDILDDFDWNNFLVSQPRWLTFFGKLLALPRDVFISTGQNKDFVKLNLL